MGRFLANVGSMQSTSMFTERVCQSFVLNERSMQSRTLLGQLLEAGHLNGALGFRHDGGLLCLDGVS